MEPIMAVIRFLTAVKSSVLAAVLAAIDAGGGAGTIKIYTGTMPATPATAIGVQVLLGTLTFSDPAGSETGGTLTMSAITQDSSADNTGTATWARIADSTGTAVMDIDITTTGGGGVMQMNTTNLVIGGPILISSFVLTVA
jgi:hypothetical protein